MIFSNLYHGLGSNYRSNWDFNADPELNFDLDPNVDSNHDIYPTRKSTF